MQTKLHDIAVVYTEKFLKIKKLFKTEQSNPEDAE